MVDPVRPGSRMSDGGTRPAPAPRPALVELADFDPSTGHLHACRAVTPLTPGLRACDCAALLFGLAESPDLLTPDEEEALDLSGRLAAKLRILVTAGRRGDDTPDAVATAEGDWAELAAAVHLVQRYVMSQAASRARPDRYRLLGRSL